MNMEVKRILMSLFLEEIRVASTGENPVEYNTNNP